MEIKFIAGRKGNIQIIRNWLSAFAVLKLSIKKKQTIFFLSYNFIFFFLAEQAYVTQLIKNVYI